MRSKIVPLLFLASLSLTAGKLPCLSQSPPVIPAAEIVPKECLVLRTGGRGGRSALHADVVERQVVEGKWLPPKAGEAMAQPNGTTASWAAISAEKDGAFRNPALRGGYAFLSVERPTAQVMVLEASGHDMVYVNGEPRGGDIYQTGWTRLPVWLHPGANALLFHCGRGELHVKLTVPPAPAFLNTSDMTLPDLILGEKASPLGAVIVVNATNAPLTGLTLRAARPGASAAQTFLPPLPPLTMRKVAFRIPGPSPSVPGNFEVALTLFQKTQGRVRTLDTAKIGLRARRPGETYKRTFVSDIDGSVQYYAVNPAHPLAKNGPPLALFLSLHGAGVEAIGQADAYESKTWGNIVAPTNRRPYGFDWEDWGRLDAMEVLHLAQESLHPDPARIYLTGHSMGGHGTWQIGATFPDRFAAIGPSAGWISFQSYVGANRPQNSTPMESMLARPMAPSDTLALKQNYAQEGVYILQGGADDNVPPTEARTMNRELSAFHHDFVYHEQPGVGHWWDISDEPGADCVDWAPMFDFFAHHALPDDAEVRQVDFTTADPGVSAWCHWAGIDAQTHPLQFSSVHIRLDPGKRRFVGTTENVARLVLRPDSLGPEGTLTVELDGQKLDNIPYPTQTGRLTLARTGNAWAVIAPPSPAFKNPARCGPFKQAFRHRMLFVYGTQGTPEENAWAFAKARYDAETFWYRGNGSVDMVADTAFDAAKERDRSVILYGNADTNAAWKPLLSDSPVQVSEGRVRVGNHDMTGANLACLFLRPRPNSDTACVGVVAGTGLVGMRLTDRRPYFSSGVEYPDCLVFGADMLTKGAEGVRAAGFFGQDWSVETGEFVYAPNRTAAK